MWHPPLDLFETGNNKPQVETAFGTATRYWGPTLVISVGGWLIMAAILLMARNDMKTRHFLVNFVLYENRALF